MEEEQRSLQLFTKDGFCSNYSSTSRFSFNFNFSVDFKFVSRCCLCLCLCVQIGQVMAGCERYLPPNPPDHEAELICSGKMNRAQIEAAMRNASDYTSLRLVNCTLDSVPDPPAQGLALGNLDLMEIRNCTIGSWLKEFDSMGPDFLIIDSLELIDTDAWVSYLEEMRFSGTIPFHLAIKRSVDLIRSVDAFFPLLAGQSATPKSLSIDLSFNDLSYWEGESLNGRSIAASLFASFANQTDLSSSEVVKLNKLILVNTSLTKVPQIDIVIQELLNLSHNSIRQISASDFATFKFVRGAVVDLSNNPIDDESLELGTFRKQLIENGVSLIFKSREPEKATDSDSDSDSDTVSVSVSVPDSVPDSVSVSESDSEKAQQFAKSVNSSEANENIAPSAGEASVPRAKVFSVTTITLFCVLFLVSSCAIVGVVILVRQCREKRRKAAERASEKADAKKKSCTSEIDTSRWDPEHGIINTDKSPIRTQNENDKENEGESENKLLLKSGRGEKSNAAHQNVTNQLVSVSESVKRSSQNAEYTRLEVTER